MCCLRQHFFEDMVLGTLSIHAVKSTSLNVKYGIKDRSEVLSFRCHSLQFGIVRARSAPAREPRPNLDNFKDGCFWQRPLVVIGLWARKM